MKYFIDHQNHIRILTYDFQIRAPLKPWTKEKLKEIFIYLLRILFWAIVIEIILHYFYFSALMQHENLMRTIPLWALAGVCYCQGQFFMLKYVVMFGFPRTIAQFDQLEVANKPKCISHIVFYSETWK